MSEAEQAVDQGVDERPMPEGWYPDPGNQDRERYWDGEAWGRLRKEPRQRATGKANRLAVTALICSCVGPIFVGGILATVLGSVALDEIEEADGAERGQGMAKWAIGIGFLNIVLSAAVVVLVVALVSR